MASRQSLTTRTRFPLAPITSVIEKGRLISSSSMAWSMGSTSDCVAGRRSAMASNADGSTTIFYPPVDPQDCPGSALQPRLLYGTEPLAQDRLVELIGLLPVPRLHAVELYA